MTSFCFCFKVLLLGRRGILKSYSESEKSINEYKKDERSECLGEKENKCIRNLNETIPDLNF